MLARMAQPQLEQLLVARGMLDEALKPLATLISDVIESDSLRQGLAATPAHGELVRAASHAARDLVDVLAPTANSGVSRDVTRAVNLLDGVSWDRLDGLFGASTTTDPGDILRYRFVKHAEVMVQSAEIAMERAARQAAADMRSAAT